MRLLRRAKGLARRYYELTGRPLGITGEIAEFEAARRLGVKLAPPRTQHYDGILRLRGRNLRVQIKGRRLNWNSKPGQRMGGIKGLGFDGVLLVLLDEKFEATESWYSSRSRVKRLLTRPGSKARNERGALAVNQFKRRAELLYSRGTQ